jgi:hypothetical protein
MRISFIFIAGLFAANVMAEEQLFTKSKDTSKFSLYVQPTPPATVKYYAATFCDVMSISEEGKIKWKDGVEWKEVEYCMRLAGPGYGAILKAFWDLKKENQSFIERCLRSE